MPHQLQNAGNVNGVLRLSTTCKSST